MGVHQNARLTPRFQREGLAGLRDRSSRPQHSPSATAEALQLAVVALRRQRLTLSAIASPGIGAASPTAPAGSTCMWPSTTAREWAYARAYGTSAQRINALPRWLHGYNWHRSHASLAG